MIHFLICRMAYAAHFALFHKFLVIKIAERIQQISRDKCDGCAGGFVLDQLHPCMRMNLDARTERFLPKAKYDALTRLDSLFNMFGKTTYVESLLASAYVEAAEQFLDSLQPHQVLDRRYVNEDSVIEHPFDQTWLLTSLPVPQNEQIHMEIPFLAMDNTLPSIEEVGPANKKMKTSKRKRPIKDA